MKPHLRITTSVVGIVSTKKNAQVSAIMPKMSVHLNDKLYWGLKTAGIEILRSQVTKVSDELGVCVDGYTFSFSKEDHQAIQNHWNHETKATVGNG